MKIILKQNFSTELLTLDIDTTGKVKNLREQAAAKLNVEPANLRINYWGDIMEDDVPLSVYKMKEDDVVNYEIIKKQPLKKMKTNDSDDKENAKPAEPIKIFLKKEDKELPFEVFPEDTVAMVRFKISEKYGFPHEGIILKYKGMPLFPIRRLLDFTIYDGAVLDLIIDEKMLQVAKENKKEEQEAKEENKKEEEPKVSVNKDKKTQIKLTATSSENKSVEVEADPEENVEELVKKIKESFKIEEKVQLVVEQRIASEEESLTNLDLKDGSVVYIKKPNEIQVRFKRLAGDCVNLIVDPKKTILEVKQILETKINSKPASQTIKFNGAILDNKKSLSDYDIKDGTLLDLTVLNNMFFNKK